MGNDRIFRYAYSAKQNEEVRAIRSKYIPAPESKLDELRRLEQCVQKAGTMQSLLTGVIGGFIFSVGLYCSTQTLFVGSIICLCGMVMMIAAYPVYSACSRKSESKYRPRILELIAELSNIAS